MCATYERWALNYEHGRVISRFQYVVTIGALSDPESHRCALKDDDHG